MRPTYWADCSSEIDIGSVARIQKLPSSSFGMNSPPSQGKAQTPTRTGTSPMASTRFGQRSAAAEERRVEPDAARA